VKPTTLKDLEKRVAALEENPFGHDRRASKYGLS
jgi:hypothetical protein